jgi:hypothetical protein
MAARTPRRSFANPFVVTLAVAPACYATTSPPQQQETAQVDPPPPTVVSNPPRPAPPPDPQPEPPRPPIMNPPRPTGQPDPQPLPPVMNPPPPQVDPAPHKRPPIRNPPRPTPQRQQPAPQEAAWTVFKSNDGCMAVIKVECPRAEPGKPQPTCNPPPPFNYACPTGVSLDKPITIVTFGDSCIIQREPIACPPKVMCNPPRPQTVTCPKP